MTAPRLRQQSQIAIVQIATMPDHNNRIARSASAEIVVVIHALLDSHRVAGRRRVDSRLDRAERVLIGAVFRSRGRTRTPIRR